MRSGLAKARLPIRRMAAWRLTGLDTRAHSLLKLRRVNGQRRTTQRKQAGERKLPRRRYPPLPADHFIFMALPLPLLALAFLGMAGVDALPPLPMAIPLPALPLYMVCPVTA